ncbi:MAG: hypothetical protein HW392_664 [Steroidobacteraceae bacterium]|nr:hypothetical protein [Steroidobacteraceae bacterium]
MPRVKTMNLKLTWILAAWLASVALPAVAEEPAPEQGVAWESLTEAQQKLLAKQRETWNTIPPGRQQAMAVGAERWVTMTPEQQAKARERWSKWKKLPPEQRGKLRDRWRRFHELTPEEKEALRDKYQRFQSLSAEQREALRDRWRSRGARRNGARPPRRRGPRVDEAPALTAHSRPARLRGRISAPHIYDRVP